MKKYTFNQLTEDIQENVYREFNISLCEAGATKKDLEEFTFEMARKYFMKNEFLFTKNGEEYRFNEFEILLMTFKKMFKELFKK